MDKHYLDKKSVFLDVTAQICRLIGDGNSNLKIMAVLKEFLQASSGKKLLTSSIVYSQFLDALVKDIIWLRDLVKKHFLDQMVFKLALIDLKKIVNEANFLVLSETEKSRLRQRLELLCETLEAKYSCNKHVETKRVLRFLDSYARDLMFRDFFKVRIGKNTTDVEYVQSDIDCTVQEPLQIDCNIKNCEYCVLRIHFDRIDHRKCLSVEPPVINCNFGEKTCSVISQFIKENSAASKKYKLLYEEVRTPMPFGMEFREGNGEWIEFLSELTRNCSNLKGRECYDYFQDVLILILCPDNAFILSRKKYFGELGTAINRPDILFDF